MPDYSQLQVGPFDFYGAYRQGVQNKQQDEVYKTKMEELAYQKKARGMRDNALAGLSSMFSKELQPLAATDPMLAIKIMEFQRTASEEQKQQVAAGVVSIASQANEQNYQAMVDNPQTWAVLEGAGFGKSWDPSYPNRFTALTLATTSTLKDKGKSV